MSTAFARLLWQSDLLATRFTLAIAAVMTGLMIAAQPEYWPIGGAYIVAGLFLAQGVVMAYTILHGWHKSSLGVYLDAILGCALWSGVCATNLLSDPWHYSDAAHLALAAASWWSLVRWETRRD